MNKLRYSNGFTLIELVVVVIILGVLLSLILLLAYPPIEHARDSVCGSNKQQIVSLAFMFADECRSTGISVPSTMDSALLGSDTNLIGRALTSNAPVCPEGGSYTIHFYPDIIALCNEHTHNN